jgi:hypothetical protein
MTVYNGARFLRDAVESILNQTFDDFEFLIVDDGSTDVTPAVLAEYQHADSRICVQTQSNRGQCPSLNDACRSARANYIARMDSDDVSRPDRFEKQMEFLSTHPDVALVGAQMVRVTDADVEVDVWRYPTANDELQEALLASNVFAHPSVVFRRDVFLKVGGYRCQFAPAEDYDLWLRIADQHAIANLPDPLLRYRLHGDNLSVQNLRTQVVGALSAQAATRIRRVSGVDPLDGAELSESRLAALQITTERFAEVMVGACFGWAGLMTNLGNDSAAEGLLLEAESNARVLDDKSAIARSLIERARIHWRSGRPVRTALALGHAARFDARQTTGAAIRSRGRLASGARAIPRLRLQSKAGSGWFSGESLLRALIASPGGVWARVRGRRR